MYFPKENNQYSKFTYYFLMSMYYNCVYNSLGGGGIIKALKATDMGNFNIPWPDEVTQKKIAEFIDGQIIKVDTLISNVQAQIDRLKEYKQSVITEVVTKGLDPSVPMKDSGVEWIGQIPETWKTLKFKHIATVKSNLVEPSLYSNYPQISPENIEKGSG